MIKSLTPLVLALALGSPALWSAEDEHEQKLVEKDVPAAVLTTMKASADGAKLGEYESETKAGKAVFTATFTDKKGVEQEVTVAPDGKLISVVKEDDDNHHDGENAKETGDDKKPDAK